MPFILDVQDEQGTSLGGGCILCDHYQFLDGSQVTVLADMAWCHGCQAFTLAERFPSVPRLEYEAEEYFYAKYPEERTPYMQRIMRQVLIGMKADMVERHRLMLDYLPHRRSPPRCLECGGTEFVRFEEWYRWYDHPAGRGRFRVDFRGHIDASLHRLYDPEGLALIPGRPKSAPARGHE